MVKHQSLQNKFTKSLFNYYLDNIIVLINVLNQSFTFLV